MFKAPECSLALSATICHGGRSCNPSRAGPGQGPAVPTENALRTWDKGLRVPGSWAVGSGAVQGGHIRTDTQLTWA